MHLSILIRCNYYMALHQLNTKILSIMTSAGYRRYSVFSLKNPYIRYFSSVLQWLTRRAPGPRRRAADRQHLCYYTILYVYSIDKDTCHNSS